MCVPGDSKGSDERLERAAGVLSSGVSCIACVVIELLGFGKSGQ